MLLLQFDVNHIIILAPPTVCVSLSDQSIRDTRLLNLLITGSRTSGMHLEMLVLFIVFCKTVDNVSSTFEKQIYIFVPKKNNKRWMDENRINLVAFLSVSDWSVCNFCSSKNTGGSWVKVKENIKASQKSHTPRRIKQQEPIMCVNAACLECVNVL